MPKFFNELAEEPLPIELPIGTFFVESISSKGGSTGQVPVIQDNKKVQFSKLISGWTAPTGTSSKDTFDTATVTTEQLAQRVKALIEDLI